MKKILFNPRTPYRMLSPLKGTKSSKGRVFVYALCVKNDNGGILPYYFGTTNNLINKFSNSKELNWVTQYSNSVPLVMVFGTASVNESKHLIKMFQIELAKVGYLSYEQLTARTETLTTEYLSGSRLSLDFFEPVLEEAKTFHKPEVVKVSRLEMVKRTREALISDRASRLNDIVLRAYNATTGLSEPNVDIVVDGSVMKTLRELERIWLFPHIADGKFPAVFTPKPNPVVLFKDEMKVETVNVSKKELFSLIKTFTFPTNKEKPILDYVLSFYDENNSASKVKISEYEIDKLNKVKHFRSYFVTTKSRNGYTLVALRKDKLKSIKQAYSKKQK